MTTEKTPLIRETFPVGPLQCNCTIMAVIMWTPCGHPAAE